jgi:hypothetical protein
VFHAVIASGAKQSRDNSPRALPLDCHGRQGGLAMTAMCVRTSGGMSYCNTHRREAAAAIWMAA